jgi:6-phosphogluconolactonase (cycloisomerase 2 family)
MDPFGLYLFSVNRTANEIAVFSVHTDGSLAFLCSARSRGGPASLAVTQGARPQHLPAFAEVASNAALVGGLFSYAVDPASGFLSSADSASTGSQGSFAVTTASRGKIVYTVDAQSGGNIYGFALDGAAGTLTSVVGSPFAAGMTPDGFGITPVAVTADESNRLLFVASNSYVTSGNDKIPLGAVEVLAPGGNGTLNPVAGSPFDDDKAANAIAADPTGRFLYVANFVDGTSDTVSGFSIAADSGGLSPIPGSPFSTLRPTAIAIHPNGKFAFVANGQGIDRVLTFKIDATTGALCCAIAAPPLPQNLLGLALDGEGKFLYALSGSPTNGAPGAVTAFRIDENRGVLSQIAASYTIPAGASAAAVDPSGKFLYVTAHDAGLVSLFPINPSTGTLGTRTDFLVTSPTGIAITESLQ